MRKEQSLKPRLLLALLPLAIVFILLGIEVFVRQHVLFTSLVSSVFLIYLLPKHPMNDSLTLVISQGLAALVGYGSFWFTLLLVLLGRLHPPAIATSLIFNYRTHDESDLMLFGLLLGLIGMLFLMKKFLSFMNGRQAPDNS